MAVPRVRAATPAEADVRATSEDVELYHRTYTTLLRSSGETRLRVLEPVHQAMGSSLHGLAASEDIDLGALIYACRRLPADIWTAERIVLGQEAVQFSRVGMRIVDWEQREAPARRRRWFADERGTLAVLLASGSDLDDLLPTLVAYQLEWNKLHRRLLAAPDLDADAAACAEALGGDEADWERLFEAFGATLDEVRGCSLDLRVRMLGGSAVGYARMTRRWWRPVQTTLADLGVADRPLYLVSSNTHSLSNLFTGVPRTHEDQVVRWIAREGPEELRDELERFRGGEAQGSWENFLYYAGRDALDPRAEEERAAGVTHLSSATALRVSAQVMPLERLRPELFDPRLGDVDADALAAARGVIVNIEYPLGLAAYNILREITRRRTRSGASTCSARRRR